MHDRLRRVKNDDSYRRSVFLMLTFLFNIIYLAVMAWTAWRTRAVWVEAMTGYSLIVTVMRALLIRSLRNDKPISRWRAYRNCGIIMIILTLVMSTVRTLLQLSYYHPAYAGVMMYVIVAFAVVRVVLSVRGLVVGKGISNPLHLADAAIKMSSAAISFYIIIWALMAFLEVSVGPEFLINLILGFAVEVYIIVVSIYMTCRGAYMVHKIKKETAKK